MIEAVFEELGVKRELFGKLNRICPQHTIFASNTSTLSITEIAGGSGRDDRVVGTALLPAGAADEADRGVARHQHVGRDVRARRGPGARRPGRCRSKTQDKPGFILNALLVPFNNDCIRAVEAGVATPQDIDTAIKVGLGYKMGPLELIDLIGLDTQLRLCEAFYPVTLDPRAAAPPLLQRMVAAGLLGRKSGRGFFNYDPAKMFGA